MGGLIPGIDSSQNTSSNNEGRKNVFEINTQNLLHWHFNPLLFGHFLSFRILPKFQNSMFESKDKILLIFSGKNSNK